LIKCIIVVLKKSFNKLRLSMIGKNSLCQSLFKDLIKRFNEVIIDPKGYLRLKKMHCVPILPFKLKT